MVPNTQDTASTECSTFWSAVLPHRFQVDSNADFHVGQSLVQVNTCTAPGSDREASSAMRNLLRPRGARAVPALVRARTTRFKPTKPGLHELHRRAVDCAPYRLSALLL